MNDTTDPSRGYVPPEETTVETSEETTGEMYENIREDRERVLINEMVGRLMHNLEGSSEELEQVRESAKKTLGKFVFDFVKIEMENQAKSEGEHLNPMTGVLNRKGAERIFDLLDKEKKRKGGEGRMVVVRLDLDNFKKVNDLTSHSVGDNLLKAVANRLRETDIITHFSGDEFGLLLPDVKPGERKKKKINLDETIKEILARVVSDIEEEGEKIKTDNPELGGVNITASVGYKIVSADRQPDETFTKLDEQADQSVALSKKLKGTKLTARQRIIGADEEAEHIGKTLEVSDASLAASNFMNKIGRALDDLKTETTKDAQEQIDEKMKEIKRIIIEGYDVKTQESQKDK